MEFDGRKLLEAKVYEVYGKTWQEIEEDVERVKEWFRAQPHLPDVPREKRILLTLILNKCSVEVTKQKLENAYTIISNNFESFQMINPTTELMKNYADVTYVIPLPKLTPDLYRIYVVKIASTDPSKFDPLLSFGHFISVIMTNTLTASPAIGSISITDCENIKLEHLAKCTPSLTKKATAIVQSTLGLAGQIHYVNCPPYMDHFLTIVRSILKPKIAKRIFIHSNLESLQQHVSKELLPRDYGGQQKSLAELHENMKLEVGKQKEYFDHLYSLTVDESLRPMPLAESDDGFGVDGTFKKLNID